DHLAADPPHARSLPVRAECVLLVADIGRRPRLRHPRLPRGIPRRAPDLRSELGADRLRQRQRPPRPSLARQMDPYEPAYAARPPTGRSDEDDLTPRPITSRSFSRSLETSGEKSESPETSAKVSMCVLP